MSKNFEPYNDEMGLYELFATLWSARLLIAAVTLICGVMGSWYASVAPPRFRAEVHLLPAEKAVMTVYNPVDYGYFRELGIRYLSADVALAETLNQIRSVAQISKFVKSRRFETFRNKVDLKDDELFEAVAGLVAGSIEISKNKNAPQTIVSYQHSDAVQTSVFLSELLVWAQNQVLAQRVLEIENIIERRLEVNKLQMQRLKQAYEIWLGAELAVLDEALAIASELNITNNQTGVFALRNGVRLQEKNTLYLKGTKLLSAERVALKERAKDSRFFRQVRLLEEENQTLNDLKQIDFPKGAILAVDKPASIPPKMIAPKKKQILVLSIVLGIMVGVLYVLNRGALRNKYSKQSL